MVCTGVLGSEVGFGWVLRLCSSLVLAHVLECLGIRRLGGSFFGIVADFPPSRLCHLWWYLIVVWIAWCHRLCGIGGVSPCAWPLGFRIVLMSEVNYRYTHTVIVRVGIRVGWWVRSVAVNIFGHIWLSAVGAVTPAMMVAVGLYQEDSCSFRCVVDAECFSPEGQALSMQF
jgi:hypothetical protein